jgi:hypothetical protein
MMGNIMSSNVALHRLFEQVNSSTSNPLTKKPENEEKCRPKCPHYFGYLAENTKDTISFPEECLMCSRVVDCILLPLVNINAHPFVGLKEENENELALLAPTL